MTLGQRLKEARIERKMTQQEVVGDFISRNMLSKIENDSATPSMKTLEYLAERLGLNMGNLCGSITSSEDKIEYKLEHLERILTEKPETFMRLYNEYRRYWEDYGRKLSYLEAEYHININNLSQAEKLLDPPVQEDFMYFFLKGKLMMKMGKHEEGVLFLKKAECAGFPLERLTELYCAAEECYQKMGDYEKAYSYVIKQRGDIG